MEVTMGWRLVIICCFVTGVLAVSEGACRFQVPPSQQVNAEEDTVVRFNITNTCGLDPDIASVGVVKDDQNNVENTICRIRLNTAEKNSNCSCHKQGQNYSCQVKYRFPRQPEVRWELRGVPAGRIEQQVISFNVTYPTVLRSFTIASHNTSFEVETTAKKIQLDCTWKDGNPQRDVRIFNPHNKPLEQTKHKEGDKSFYRFSLPSVKCNDSGLYRCEVADSGQSLSISLLVRCVLKFRDTNANAHKKTVQMGSDARLQFAVHSYTAELKFCQLTHPSTTKFNCNSTRSEVMMKGTPPHLQLQLRLKNVVEEDAGTWKLQARNDITSGSFPSVSFTLDVIAPTSISTTSSLAPGSGGGGGEGAEEPQEQGGLPWLYIGVGCAAVLILIVIVIYFGVLKPKGQRTAQGRRSASTETVANANSPAGPSEDNDVPLQDIGLPPPDQESINTEQSHYEVVDDPVDPPQIWIRLPDVDSFSTEHDDYELVSDPAGPVQNPTPPQQDYINIGRSNYEKLGDPDPDSWPYQSLELQPLPSRSSSIQQDEYVDATSSIQQSPPAGADHENTEGDQAQPTASCYESTSAE